MSTVSTIVIVGYGSDALFSEVQATLATDRIHHEVTSSEGLPLTIVSDSPLTVDAYQVFTQLYDDSIQDEVIGAFSEGADRYELPTPHEVVIEGTTYRLLAEFVGFDEDGEPMEL